MKDQAGTRSPEMPRRSGPPIGPLAAALILLLVGGRPGTGSAEDLFVFHPPGQPHTLEGNTAGEADLFYTETGRSPYSECWYYLAMCEDGTVFFCHLNLAKINWLIKQYSLDFNLYLPDGTRTFFADSYDKKEVAWGTDRLLVKLGPNRLTGTLAEQQLHIEASGYVLDLLFRPQGPPFRDGEGRIYLDEKHTDYLDITYQPALRVTGSVLRAGKRQALSGWGYGDHVRQTFIPTDFAKRLYAFRVQMGDLFLTVLEYFPNPEFTPSRVPSLILTYQGRLLHVSHDYPFEQTRGYTDPARGVTVPRDIRLRERTDTVDLDCRATGTPLKRVDLLASVSPLQKKVLNLFGVRSYSYIFEEATECRLRSPDVSGTFTGTGILEVLSSD